MGGRWQRAACGASMLGLAAALTARVVAPREASAQDPAPAPEYQVLFVPSLVRNVCAGDAVTFSFTATQTNVDPLGLAPLVPLSPPAEPAAGQETFTIEASGGTVTPARVQLFGEHQAFTLRFVAGGAGPASLTVRAARGVGGATRSFTVLGSCDYRVEAFGRAVVASHPMRVEEVFVARGTLLRARRGDTAGGGARALAGDGRVDVRADLFGALGPVHCSMDPMIAHGTFETRGTAADDAVEFSFDFGPITFEHPIVFRCTAPGGARLTLPVNTGTQGGDGNRLGLRDLSLPPSGGSISFAYGPCTGVVTLSQR